MDKRIIGTLLIFSLMLASLGIVIANDSFTKTPYTDMVIKDIRGITPNISVGDIGIVVLEIENRGEFASNMIVDIGFLHESQQLPWHLLIHSRVVQPWENWTFRQAWNYSVEGEWRHPVTILETGIHDVNQSNNFKEISINVTEN